jgi:hypothetical protein
MSRKGVIRTVFTTDKFSLHECNDGYWLYDFILGMNLSMRAKTEQDAYLEALMYYQKRLETVKSDYKKLDGVVDNFLSELGKVKDLSDYTITE